MRSDRYKNRPFAGESQEDVPVEALYYEETIEAEAAEAAEQTADAAGTAEEASEYMEYEEYAEAAPEESLSAAAAEEASAEAVSAAAAEAENPVPAAAEEAAPPDAPAAPAEEAAASRRGRRAEKAPRGRKARGAGKQTTEDGVELNKLKKKDLLEIMLAQGEEIDRLRAQVAELEAKLEDRNFELAKVGSIAEASLAVTNIFKEAEKAAAIYLENIRRRYGDR